MRWAVFTLLMVVSVVTLAGDLPKMGYINENKMLRNFPLGSANKAEVFEKYGPPKSTVTGLPMNSESWLYEKSPETKAYYIIFRDDVVYDVQVRYPGIFQQKSAREMQGIE
jgi:hypothetical protein